MLATTDDNSYPSLIKTFLITHKNDHKNNAFEIIIDRQDT